MQSELSANEESWQGVFLDFYGTVASGDVLAVETICSRVIQDYLLEMTPKELAVAWGDHYFAAIEGPAEPFRKLGEIERDTLIQTLEPLAGPVEVDEYIDQLNRYLSHPAIYEEVREVFDHRKLPICIVSNADQWELASALEHNRLQPDYVVSSESASSYKPAARIFETALEQTGWDRERVLHVGDSLHSDVAGAKQVGLKTAWVNRAVRISDIGNEKPDFTWTDLRPLLRLRK